jgi:hypothetical protein
MATYDPPQPLWKRNVAGILDFLLAASVFGVVVYLALGTAPHTVTNSAGATAESWGLDLGPTLLLLVLIVIYFVLLGRLGGTIFQRLFRMKRASKASQSSI